MSIVLRVILIVLSLVFLVAVIRLVSQKRLQLKYSLMWLLMGVLLLVSALFPRIVSLIAHAAGVELTSNFVFIAGIVFLMGISLSLTYIASWQSHDIRQLVQRVALLEKRIGELENKDDGSTDQ